ncbi:hypothetical protein V2J09_010325 [Rumex salicifolius]
MASEVFGLIPGPSEEEYYPLFQIGRHWRCNVFVLDGCIAATMAVKKKIRYDRIDMWRMMEYGVEASWRKIWKEDGFGKDYINRQTLALLAIKQGQFLSMKMKMSNFNTAAVLVVVVMAVSATLAAGKTHVVGDIFGWTNLGPDTNFYNLWAHIYEFHFKTGEHNVAEVSKEAYESCNTTNVMNLRKKGPELSVTLTSPGPKFFICTIPGHCLEDERFAINILILYKVRPI